MPAIVHSNSALISGMALIDESIAEEASGLVRVTMNYVHRATNSARLSRLFYADAPPPIFPAALAPSDLLSRKLYMVDRTVSQSNGLTYVQAQYAGGFANKRSNHLRYVQRESPRSVVFVSEPFSIKRNDPNGSGSLEYNNVTNSYSYSWIPYVHTFEYIEIGNIASYTPAAPSLFELFELTAWAGGVYVPAPELGWSAIKFIPYEKSWFEKSFNPAQLTIKEDRKPTFVTPTVRTIQHRFYL
jgi:hypothetical protein